MRLLSFLLLFALAMPARAQTETPPADRIAKLIAPYVDEDTFAVVRVDLEKFNLEDVLERLKKLALLPDEKDVETGAALVGAMQRTLVKAGAKDLFAFSHWSAAAPIQDVLLVLPFAEKTEAQAAAAALKLAKVLQVKTRDNVLLAGTPGAFAWADQLKPRPAPELARGLAALDGYHVQALVMPPEVLRKALVEVLPRLPTGLGGGPTSKLAQGMRWVALGEKGGAQFEFRFIVQCRDAQAAKDVRAAIEVGYAAFEKMEDVQYMLPNVSKLRDLLLPKVQGDRLVAELDARAWQDFFAPLAGQTRERALEQRSLNNLKQMALAMHTYHDTNKTLPAAASYDKSGKALLSWRVHVLPYVEQDNLYQQFKLNEPWDSPHNKKLIARMPDIYKSPLSPHLDAGKTTYLVPVGPKTIFPGKKGLPISKIPDGTSNTILVVDADVSRAVFWTQPDDLPVDAKEPWAGLLRPKANGVLVVFADGSARLVRRTLAPQHLYGMFTAAGGEIVPDP